MSTFAVVDIFIIITSQQKDRGGGVFDVFFSFSFSDDVFDASAQILISGIVVRDIRYNTIDVRKRGKGKGKGSVAVVVAVIVDRVYSSGDDTASEAWS